MKSIFIDETWKESGSISARSMKDDFQSSPSPYREKIIRYLKNGKVKAASPGFGRDIVTGEAIKGTLCILTDGQYSWTSSLAYYVDVYNLKLPKKFEDKIVNMPEYILFPSSYFSIKKVDEDLLEEYDAVLNTGLFKTILFSYDKWFNEDRLVLTDIPDEQVTAVYRGWMMQPEKYKHFYEKLLENNIKLITAPAEYEKLHVFPNIYPDISEDTAGIIAYPDGTDIDLVQVKKTFRRFMVKDYVKSVKGTEFPKYFDNTVSEEEFNKQMEIFYKYRGELYTGGICIKEYLNLKTYGDKTNEYRVFYMNGHAATVSRNSLQQQFTNKLPDKLIEKYKNLGSPFYTVDFAEMEDGGFKIIETGDGQVSGLSEGQDYEAFFRALYLSFS